MIDALRQPFFWLLFIHVGAAIIGLGPSFVYARIGGAALKEPAHALFAMRLARGLTTRWTHPLAFVVLASGFALVWYAGYDVLATGWLLLSIVLYLLSFLYATFIQNRDLARALEIMEKSPSNTQTDSERVELAGIRRRVRYGGMFMRGIVVIVLFLMISKPS